MATASRPPAAPDTGETREIREPLPPRRRPPLRLFSGIAMALAGTGAILISAGYDSPRRVVALGPNLPVNEGARNPADINAVNSPALARNPRDAHNLAVAARIDSPRFSCSLAVTVDGGASWRQTPIPAPPRQTTCYAPDAAFGADGTLYVSYVTLRGRANAPNAVWLATSRDGGQTLSAPTRVPIRRHPFQVRLATDPQQPGRVYVTWLQAAELGLYKFTEPGNPIRAMRSDDGGRNWTRPAQANDPARQRVVAPVPAVGPDGELYVAFLDLGDDRLDYHGAHRGRGGAPYDGRWQLVLARSTDRGATWEESVAEEAVVPTERFIVFTPSNPSLAVDGRDGRIYAGFHDGRHGDPDVFVWSLTPGASAWDGPVRVNDTPLRDGTAQYQPALSVASDGRLDVVYYDRRGDRTNVLNEVSLQSSFDEGDNFSRRTRLSDDSFSSRIGPGAERRMPDLGSRLGAVSTDRRALAVWTDTRAGTPETAKQDIARGIAAFTDPPRLAGWLETLLRWGGAGLVLVGLVLAVSYAAQRRGRPA